MSSVLPFICVGDNLVHHKVKRNISEHRKRVFSSPEPPELKAYVSFSDLPLSGICLSVCPSVNFHIFNFFFRTTGPILTRLCTNHPWVDRIQVCSNERDSPSPRGDNSERVKIQCKILKIFFSRTSGPN
jgi:hypothetical protein